MLLIDVATETINAIMKMLLISSDEFSFVPIFEQSALFVLKVVSVPAFFAVTFIDVAGTFIDVDVFRVSVAATNLIIGS